MIFWYLSCKLFIKNLRLLHPIALMQHYFKKLLYEDYPTITFIYLINKINEFSFRKILELKYPKTKLEIILIGEMVM